MSAADPIRLALVITELAPGGAERCLVEIATRLDRRRFSPVVYSLGPQPAEEQRLLVRKLAAAGIPTHFLDLSKAWHFFAGVRRLAQLLREQQAEVVQTFLFHANVVGARASRTAGVPHLLTGLRVADPRRWRTRLERWETQAAQRHVCVSQGVADFYRGRGFAADTLVVIPNGIDVARWRDARPIDLASLGMTSGRRAIVFVGRLDKQKGLVPLFRELPTALREVPDHDLVLVGDGPQRGELASLAQQLGMADRIHFAGWRSDVAEILAAADALVLPSRWEGMPNVILEAMAAGKPVVATRVEGVAELLGDSAGEQAVPSDESRLICDRLVSLLRDKTQLKLLATHNQERAIQQFSIGFSVAEYDRLYSGLARPAQEKNL